MWGWVELQEGVFHELVNFHDGCLVTASIAVVWRRKDSDDVTVVGPVVAVHDELMSTSNQFEVV